MNSIRSRWKLDKLKMTEIINEQNVIKFDSGPFENFIADFKKYLDEVRDKEFTVVFVDDNKIKDLNNQFRSKNYVTDVLSFGYETEDFEPDNNYLGDIIISAEQAQRQARQNNLSLDLEIKRLILHGVLHLCGYDHETDEGEMNRLELELREKVKI